VCVVDSGIDTQNSDFQNRVIDEKCFCRHHLSGCCPNGEGEDDSAEDDNGHGTHVAGIIGANNVNQGINPNVFFYIVKVCNEDGKCRTSDIANGINWCRENTTSDIISISFDDGDEHLTQSECDSYIDSQEVNTAKNSGINVVISSGNEGYSDGISSPACASGAFSVGSSYDEDFGSVGWCVEENSTI
jgi:subtilisin family serine protease